LYVKGTQAFCIYPFQDPSWFLLLLWKLRTGRADHENLLYNIVIRETKTIYKGKRIMTQYQLLSGEKRLDFRYKRDGSYTNCPNKRRGSCPEPVPERKGKKCPSCGMFRSLANKCFCNS
jgi:hypothetical protein